MKYARCPDGPARPPYAIVDEVDSILIDEARTPLIISGPLDDRSALYNTIDALIPKLVAADYEIDEKQRTATSPKRATRRSRSCCARPAALKGSLYDIENVSLVHHVNQALRAHKLFQRDKDYIVRNGRGRHHRRVHRPHDAGPPLSRKACTRRWKPRNTSRSSPRTRRSPRSPSRTTSALRQARRHDRHGGDRSRRVRDIYGSTSSRCRPTCRSSASTRTTRSTAPRGKVRAIVAEIADCRKRGQPVLVGTTSIEKSELLADYAQGRLQADLSRSEGRRSTGAAAPGLRC
jgi:preprotein translocase subunit SecA